MIETRVIMGTRSSGIEKKSQVIDFNVGLGLRMQTRHHPQTLTKTNVNVLDFESHKRMSQPQPHHHHHHQHHINTLSSSSSSNSGEGLGGSIFSSTSNHKTCLVGSCNSSSTSTSCCCCSACLIIHSNPTDAISDSVYAVPAPQPTNPLTLPFLSSGGLMATSGNLRAGFTASQWEELKTQTMIFKYMMASAPVPPELLLPITKNPPLQRSNRTSDPEPWRCRRTDGKKWRCSRDVAPHQKYCERHSHKNRPRSRKPVELQAQHHVVNSNSNPQLQSIDDVNNYNRPYQRFHFDVQNQTDDPGPLFPSQLPSAAPHDHDQPRYLEWLMNGENIAVNNPNNGEWNQYVHNTKVGFTRDIDSSHNTTPATAAITTCSRDVYHLKQTHVPLYACASTTTAQELLAPKLTSFLDPNGQGHETRHFIDAWSDAAPRDDGIDVNGNVNVGSSLSLTMHGGSEGNQVTGASAINLKPHWTSSDVDWMSSPPGGPLAEVLCLGTGGSARLGVYETSPHGCSSITTASSRSSCKADGQELNFIN